MNFFSFLRRNNNILSFLRIHRVHQMCNPPMCSIFLKNLCFAPCPQCAILYKKRSYFYQKSRIDNCLVFSGSALNLLFIWISSIALGRISSSKERSLLRLSWASNVVDNSLRSLTWSISDPTRPLLTKTFQ